MRCLGDREGKIATFLIHPLGNQHQNHDKLNRQDRLMLSYTIIDDYLKSSVSSVGLCLTAGVNEGLYNCFLLVLSCFRIFR